MLSPFEYIRKVASQFGNQQQTTNKRILSIIAKDGVLNLCTHHLDGQDILINASGFLNNGKKVKFQIGENLLEHLYPVTLKERKVSSSILIY